MEDVIDGIQPEMRRGGVSGNGGMGQGGGVRRGRASGSTGTEGRQKTTRPRVNKQAQGQGRGTYTLKENGSPSIFSLAVWWLVSCGFPLCVLRVHV